MKMMNIPRFSIPGFGDDTKELYIKLYGEDAGSKFFSILTASPDEISVISRLIAYLAEKKGREA